MTFEIQGGSLFKQRKTLGMKSISSLPLFLFLLIFSGLARAAYDPTVGVWLSRDPIGEARGYNLYSYVLNNPMNYTDPMGLYAQVLVNGNNVTIILPIDFHQGSVANGPNGPTIVNGPIDPKLVQQIIQNIQNTWSGKIGPYNVTTKVTTPGSNCPPDKKNNWNILNNSPPDMPAFSPDPNTVLMPGNRAPAAAHEAGHLMNLPDPTDANGNYLNTPGTMGPNLNARPTPSEIQNVINHN